MWSLLLQGHRFRSRAFVEYGDPMEIDPGLVDEYRQGLEAKGTGKLRPPAAAAAAGAKGAGGGGGGGSSRPVASRSVVGVGTAFAAELKCGDTVIIRVGGGNRRAVVVGISGDNELQLSTPLWSEEEFALLAAAKKRQAAAGGGGDPEFSAAGGDGWENGGGGGPEQLWEFTISSKAGKARQHAACNQLLEEITEALMTVTVNAPDAETLKSVWTARALYKPSHQRLSPTQSVELTRRMLRGLQLARARPEMAAQVEAVMGVVQTYEQKLEEFGLRDWQVGTTATELNELVHNLMTNTVHVLCYTLFLAVPGALASPLYFLSRFIAEREAAKAVAGSSVKIKGVDVMATFKVMTWMVCGPLMVLLYSLLAAAYFDASTGLVTLIILPHMWQTSFVASDNWRRLLRSLKPLWLAIFQEGQVSELVVSRRNAKNAVRGLVRDLGETLGFEPMAGLDWSGGSGSPRFESSPRSPVAATRRNGGGGSRKKES
eukprot:SAG22_NODE_90_length_21067_cov_8.490843_4_plen_488_part_00